MNKQLLFQLYPGSTITYNSTDMGYTTGGIRIAFNVSMKELFSQRYKTPVSAKVETRSVDIIANFYEFPSSVYTVKDSEPTFAQLTVQGRRKNGATITFTFYKAYVYSVGEVNLSKIPGTVPVTFRAVMDENKRLFDIT